jgi:hypothetical protein
VVTSAAAELKLLLWSDTLPGSVRVPGSHTPWCITAVTMGESEALSAFALQRPFCSVVRLHLYSQAAVIGERSHFRHTRASRLRHNEVWCQGTVLLGVLIPSLRPELRDSLHIDEQGLQLLPNLGFGHSLP